MCLLHALNTTSSVGTAVVEGADEQLWEIFNEYNTLKDSTNSIWLFQLKIILLCPLFLCDTSFRETHMHA
jgi:hypothetical protein